MAAKKNGGLSPMMEQYFDIKSRYPGMLLFFRLGDFYEMFFDDAKTAADELDLVLTGKECGMDERAPMCGIPYHAVEGYLSKLIAKGYRVGRVVKHDAVDNRFGRKGYRRRGFDVYSVSCHVADNRFY